jgi:hypothetical protein
LRAQIVVYSEISFRRSSEVDREIRLSAESCLVSAVPLDHDPETSVYFAVGQWAAHAPPRPVRWPHSTSVSIDAAGSSRCRASRLSEAPLRAVGEDLSPQKLRIHPFPNHRVKRGAHCSICCLRGIHPLHIGSFSRPFTQASSHRAKESIGLWMGCAPPPPEDESLTRN